MVYYNSELDSYESYYHCRSGREDFDEDSQALVYGPGAEDFQREQDVEAVFPALGHAFSGAFGSALSNFVTYPLNVVTTRMQVRQQMQRELEDRMWERESRRERKRSGSRSGASTPRLRTPGEFIPERINRIELGSREQIEIGEFWRGEEIHYNGSYEGVWDTVESIYQDSGIRGFYAGVGWDTLSTVSAGFWYFAAYNFIRNRRLYILSLPHNLKDGKHPSIPIIEELAMGILAGAVAKFAASPLSTIVTRKQTAAMLHPHVKSPSIVTITQDIIRENGVKGLWAGYEASMLLTVNPSITFLLYEFSKSWISGRRRGEKLRTRETFLLAAVCKATATAITYPLSVARTRAQVADTRRRVKSRSRSKKRKGGVAGVMESLSDIVKQDGLGALWQGVEAEIIKGFFAHGLTMLIKEGVHRAILRLYFFVLREYNRTQHGTVQETTRQIIKDGYDNLSPRQKELADRARHVEKPRELAETEYKEKEDRETEQHLQIEERPREELEERRVERRVERREEREEDREGERSRSTVVSRIPVPADRRTSDAMVLASSRPRSVHGDTSTSTARGHSDSLRSNASPQRGIDVTERQLVRRGTVQQAPPSPVGSVAGSAAGSSRGSNGSRVPLPRRTQTYHGDRVIAPRTTSSSSVQRTAPAPAPAPTGDRVDAWRQDVVTTQPSPTGAAQDIVVHQPAPPSTPPRVLQPPAPITPPMPRPTTANNDMLRERRIAEVANSLKNRAPARRQVDADALSTRTRFSTAGASEHDSLRVHPPSEIRSIRRTTIAPPSSPRLGGRHLPAKELRMREEIEWRKNFDKAAAAAIGGGDVGIGGAVAGAEKWDDSRSDGRGWK